MGLFDKKKKGDDFDGPVEEISLTAQLPPQAAKAAQPPAPAAAPQTAAGSTKPAAAAAREPDEANYGINRAIELMRLLPADNIELVVKVVKTTLESTNVKVATIIDDATRKQSDIEGRIGVLKKEIAELEAEIATRKGEIAALEADHAETTTVKERLILAEKLSGARAAEAKPAKAETAVESGWVEVKK